jgi:hypothetical protein
MSVSGVNASHAVSIARRTDQLERRYADEQKDEASVQEEQGDGGDVLAQLEARYAVSLSESAREVLAVAMESVADGATMAGAGLYLAKLGLPVEPAALQALYAAQVGDDESASTSAQLDATAMLHNLDAHSDANLGPLAMLMGNTLDNATSGQAAAAVAQQLPAGLQSTGSGGKDRDSSDRRELARRLLNVQDEGSVAYRQGLLPVLIDGQLVELDLVYFNERREADRPAGLRRLVMTLKTQTLGRVEVLAQAVGDRLSISIKAETATSSDVLAAHADEVRDLIARLGWNVEAISYDLNARGGPAARHIVDHVLNAGTLSRFA